MNLIPINKKSDLICPKEDKAEFQLFPFSCQKDENCAGIGRNYRCCKVFGSKRCLRGVAKPKIEQRHARNVFFYCESNANLEWMQNLI